MDRSDGTPLHVNLPPVPYPGLRPFQRHEWPVYFGRERMTADVVDRVIGQHLVVVHGDSGCGKSSMVLAGVQTQLEHERARSGVQWRTIDMRPRDAPLRNFAAALTSLVGAKKDSGIGQEIRRILNYGRDAAAALADVLGTGDTNNICVTVDQFEELFAFAKARGPDEAQLLVDLLVGIHTNQPTGLYVIVTMRSEFLGACARFERLAETVNATQYLVPRMGRLALLRAIREPARLYDGEVSRALAERLIADAGGDQDQLPLVQHGLRLLWQKATGDDERSNVLPRLGLEQYEAALRASNPSSTQANGLASLLSDHADRVMADVALDEHRRSVVQHISVRSPRSTPRGTR